MLCRMRRDRPTHVVELHAATWSGARDGGKIEPLLC
jgi:hypothetical protein